MQMQNIQFQGGNIFTPPGRTQRAQTSSFMVPGTASQGTRGMNAPWSQREKRNGMLTKKLSSKPNIEVNDEEGIQ